ncbi:DUF7519 family protein [Haloarcula litorea]|uniref:DUF7519 family protein n=1 Tax=Haloarcula litorea TaxID=3032579 RepID=UPI0023E86F22|nr:hypothetical protein [Halomicroarcula sp. GDY20]
MTRYAPPRTSLALSVVAGLVPVGLAGAYGWLALACTLGGVCTLAVGVVVGSRRAVTVGAAVQTVGVLAAGVAGTPAWLALAAGVAALVAWDVGGTAVDLGVQLGADADSRRLELVHAGATTLVGTATATVGYLAYQVQVGRRPVTAPVLLVVAALCLAVALSLSER